MPPELGSVLQPIPPPAPPLGHAAAAPQSLHYACRRDVSEPPSAAAAGRASTAVATAPAWGLQSTGSPAHVAVATVSTVCKTEGRHGGQRQFPGHHRGHLCHHPHCGGAALLKVSSARRAKGKGRSRYCIRVGSLLAPSHCAHVPCAPHACPARWRLAKLTRKFYAPKRYVETVGYPKPPPLSKTLGGWVPQVSAAWAVVGCRPAMPCRSALLCCILGVEALLLWPAAGNGCRTCAWCNDPQHHSCRTPPALQVLKMSEAEVVRCAGVDAAMYLKILRMGELGWGPGRRRTPGFSHAAAGLVPPPPRRVARALHQRLARWGDAGRHRSLGPRAAYLDPSCLPPGLALYCLP